MIEKSLVRLPQVLSIPEINFMLSTNSEVTCKRKKKEEIFIAKRPCAGLGKSTRSWEVLDGSGKNVTRANIHCGK